MTFISTKRSAAVMGPLLMVAAGAVFAVANTAVQMAGMRFGVSPATTAFWQYAIAGLCALPMVAGAGWRTGRPGLHLLRVALAVIGVQMWVAGLAQVPIWQAIALILTSPLFVTFGAWALLGERLTGARVAALFFGAAGGVIIMAPWTDDFHLAALLPVGAALFWAGSSLMTKVLTTTERTPTLTAYMLLLLLPFNAVVAAPVGFAVSSEALPWIALAGVAVAAAQYLLAWAYAVSDAAYLQPFDHLKLPINVGLGFAVFGFAPPGAMWIGAAIILIATGVLMRDEISAEKS